MKMNMKKILGTLDKNIRSLNSSKFFAGVIMILLNIGSKFIQIQFSKSTEEYMKYSVSKQLLIFSMAWMGTRDIYTALGLTAVFTILSDYLLLRVIRYFLVKTRCIHRYHRCQSPKENTLEVEDNDQDSNYATGLNIELFPEALVHS